MPLPDPALPLPLNGRKPVRHVACKGCDRESDVSKCDFNDNPAYYVLWARCNLMHRYSDTFKQLAGDFCWCCDANASHSHGALDREELNTRLEDAEFKNKFKGPERTAIVRDKKESLDAGQFRRKKKARSISKNS